ncbi:MAG: ABC transporter permease [Elusimicrobia bacterium]|nr:ABC transporter permease [Elusimicrobiota bacterium]
MRVAEALRTGWLEIASHKVRSALTCLATAIGVAAMVYTFSQIAGLQERFRKATELAGPGRLEVEPKEGYVSKGLSRGLTWQDAEHIRRAFPELYMVYPIARRWGARMRFDDFKNDSIGVRGTTPEWRRRDWVYKLRGRFLNEDDVRGAARVCVLLQPGGWVKKPFWAKYFPEQAMEKVLKRRDLLGRQVRLDEHLFTVVGILQEPPRDRDPRWFRREWGGGSGGLLYVPISTYRQTLLRSWGNANPDKVDGIEVDTGEGATAALYKKRITALLKSRHRGEEDFKVRDYREIIQGVITRIRQYAIAIAVIGLVAILAGGIGIMNVTLATIFSRIKEIGIRRALGATRTDIVTQFLVEATMLGSLGGVAGAGLGLLAVTYLAPREDRMAQISLVHVGAAMAIAAAVAFFFALYPAYKAAQLDPIESLHYE